MNTRFILCTTNETKVKTFTDSEQQLLLKYFKEAEEKMKAHLKSLDTAVQSANEKGETNYNYELLVEANLYQSTTSKLHSLIVSLSK